MNVPLSPHISSVERPLVTLVRSLMRRWAPQAFALPNDSCTRDDTLLVVLGRSLIRCQYAQAPLIPTDLLASVPPLLPTASHNPLTVRSPHLVTLTLPVPALTLPLTAYSGISHALNSSGAASTRAAYKSGFNQFLSFCDAMEVPFVHHLPAGELLLCAFVGSFTGSHSCSAIQNCLSGVCAWHIAEGQPWNGGLRLSHVVSGVDRLAPPSSSRAARDAVTIKMLECLCEGLDQTCPSELCVLTCALCTFWTQSRLGELLPSLSSLTIAHCVPHCSDLSPHYQ